MVDSDFDFVDFVIVRVIVSASVREGYVVIVSVIVFVTVILLVLVVSLLMFV